MWKNILISITLAITIFSGTIVYTPPQAQASGWPVIDIAGLIESIRQWIMQLAEWAREEALAALRDRVVKQLVDKLTDDIVRSIANEGDPQFVGDWKSYLRDAGDIAFNEVNGYLEQYGLDLCSPLAPQIQLSLQYQINGARLPISCRFDDFKRAIAYSDHFIERGGWLAYDQMFIPSNNYYGLSVLARDKYYTTLEEEKTARTNEAVTSRGYLSTKVCSKLGGGLTQADINASCSDQGGDETACRKRIEKEWCAQWRVLTPGDVAAEAVSSSIKSDAWWVTNVESIVSAILNAFVSKVFDGARGGLVGSSGGGGSSIGVDNDTQNTINDITIRRLNQIRDRYEAFVDYTTQTVLPVINLASDQIQLLTCDSRTVVFEDADGNLVSMRISELENFLALAQQTTNQALAEAQAELARINRFSTANPNADAEVLDIISAYQDFTATYPVFIADLALEESGDQGSLSILYSNIYRALIQFDCGQSSF
jgi:hypothetical protein